MKHLELGNWGERLACKELQKSGFKLLFKNWRWEKAEVDIIAYHKRLLIIVEVKTRSTDQYGSPAEAVSRQKEEKLRQAALAFLEYYDLDLELRFDILSIIGNPNSYNIEHIEEAF